MGLKTILILGIGILAQTSMASERLSCTAQVALNRIYYVTLTKGEAFSTLEVKTDNGYEYKGAVNSFYSPRSNSDLYFLPAGFLHGLEVEVERTGQQRIALCLAINECYLCR